MGREARRTITEPATVRALAHPVRYELLNYLISNSPATASECARAVGDTPSNCSYHLRELAKAELVVEDAERWNARDRWWRRPERLMLAPTTGTPEETAAGKRVRAVLLERDDRALATFVAEEERLPRRWAEVAFVGNWTVHMTADELEEFSERVLEMMDEYRRPADERPEGTRPVHLSYRGLPRS